MKGVDYEGMARRALPCPFCGQRLIVKGDHHGSWVGHKNETGPCFQATAQIHFEEDLAEWNVRTSAPAS